MNDDLDELKRKTALSYQILYLEGIAIDDTLGHISARHPGAETAVVKPWGMGFDEVTPGGLVEMGLDGTKVGGGEGRLHSEMPIHTEIYRARPDVNCVIHIHPYYATLLTAVWSGEMMLVNQHSQQFAAGIGYYEDSALVRNADQGRLLAERLGEHNAVLLKNHGVVTVGVSVEQAMVFAVLLERAAQVQFTLHGHAQVEQIDREVALRWAEELSNPRHCSNKFDYWCRKLARVGTGLYSG